MNNVCRCPEHVILGDCPVSYANGAHERGEATGHDAESLEDACAATQGMPAGPERVEVYRRVAEERHGPAARAT